MAALQQWNFSSSIDDRSSSDSLDMADNVSYTSMSGVYSMVSSSTRSSLAARSSFGYVPNNNIIEDITDFQYGSISIDCAEELCSESGELLIRIGPSSKNDLRLTVKKECGHTHLTIYKECHPFSSSDHIYFLDDKTRQFLFLEVLDLIQYIVSTGYLPLTMPVRETITLHPCSKKKKMIICYSDINKGDIVNPNPKSSKAYFSGFYKQTKVVLVQKENNKKVIREADIHIKLGKINHPNILSMIGVCVNELVCLVLPHDAKRSLHNHIQTLKSSKKRHMTSISHDICCGMIYLHSINCLHRSLQSRACVIDKTNTVKIYDFDKSCFVTEDVIEPEPGECVCVPTRWAAPEVLKRSVFSKSSDVWSFGILVWEIFNSGAMPYPGLRNDEMTAKLKPGFRLTLTKKNKSHDLILEKCLRYNSNNRPNFNFLEGLIQLLL